MTLEEQIQKLTEERDAALKACAEAKEVICRMYHWDDDERSASIDAAAKHALSTDCGKGYHRDDEWKMVVEALKKIQGSWSDADVPWYSRIAEEAIAHAERLTGKDGK